MHHATFEIETHQGGRLFAQSWAPKEPAVGAVGIVHGLGEHSRRHEWFAQRLAEHGLEVVSFDLRGHGQTDGGRGHVLHFDWLMDDIGHLVAELYSRLPQGPCFLYGQSLGGSLVLNFALREQPDLRGIIATSPLLKLAKRPNVVLRTGVRTLSWLWPSFALRTGIRGEDLAADASVREAHRADPLVHGRVSARMVVQSVDASLWAFEHASELTIPSLLLHGAQDRVTLCDATRDFSLAAGRDSQFIEVDDGRHELLQGAGREAATDRIVEWILQR